MKYIKLIFLGFVAILYSKQMNAQCDVTANINPAVICAGEAVTLTATGGCGFLMANDFNNGTPGTGWVATTGVDFTNPCGTGPDLIYLWMGDNVPVPRTLTTVDFNVVGACEISFWMKYAIQSQSSPCEGPDEMDEGITLQYSINSGASWVDIAYFRPDGVILANAIPPGSNNSSITNYNTPFTVWAQYQFAVPPLAQTPNTRFRWIQQDITSLVYDHWGVDVVEILCPSGTAVQWSHGPIVLNPPQVFPTQDTCYVVTVTDTVTWSGSASDTVCVQVNPVPNATFNVESPICSDLFTNIQYTGNAGSGATYSWFFSGGQVLSGTGVGPYQVTWPFEGWQYISLEVSENGCTSQPYYDSVYVNLAPTVVFTATPTSGCMPLTVQFNDFTAPTGSNWYWSFGDGYTSTDQNPQYTYTDPGEYTVGLIVVTDAGCDDTLIRPNYIEVYGQPVADFTWFPEVGKVYDPVITFYADSTYSTDGLWDFGDGTTSTDLPIAVHTFPGVEDLYCVTLVLYNEHDCADTVTKCLQIIDDILIFPNIITPNGDGFNDQFVIPNADKYPNNILQVFNRWGKKVYEQQNYDNQWDGGGLSEGTYFYIFRYLDQEHHGSLTILRGN